MVADKVVLGLEREVRDLEHRVKSLSAELEAKDKQLKETKAAAHRTIEELREAIEWGKA